MCVCFTESTKFVVCSSFNVFPGERNGTVKCELNKSVDPVNVDANLVNATDGQ